MNTTVRTYEGKNNTYHFISTSNMTYDQQQRRKELIKTRFNKALIIIGLLTVVVISGIISTELIMSMSLICLLGIAAVATNHI